MIQIFENLDGELFRTYAFWCTILVLKMVLMSGLTGVNRFRKMAFANPEDVSRFKSEVRPTFDDPDVERVRRAHRNDLENILPFFLVAFLYLLTGPNQVAAAWLIRVAAIGRIVHSFVYAVIVIPQPARFLSFAAMLVITIYMAVMCLIYFF